jgi:hypothetical protein
MKRPFFVYKGFSKLILKFQASKFPYERADAGFK